ncbi:SLAIN motif-containing protein 1-like [Festucalex cinctus]
MEAAVEELVVVERKRTLANGELQLRRLRELVNKLELQNERPLPSLGWAHNPCTPPSRHRGPPEDRLRYFQFHDQYEMDQVELLDLDVIGFSDDETWLYMPLKKNCEKFSLTPLQWCRHVLEDPEWKPARRSMALRLESTGLSSCWFRQLSGPRTASTPSPPSKLAVMSPIGTTRSPETRASSQSHADSRSGRARTPTFIPHLTPGSKHRRCSPRPPLDYDVISPGLDEDDLSPPSYKLQDLTDVQVMARLQEDKLRQDSASASSERRPPRRRSVAAFPLSARPDPQQEDEAGGEDRAPAPERSLCPQSGSFPSARPSAPPRPSEGRLRAPCPPGADKTRTSLPNLVRAHSLPIASLLANCHSFDSPGCCCCSCRLTRLHSSMASLILRRSQVQSTWSLSSSSRQPPKAAAYVCARSSRSPGSRIPMLGKCSSPCVWSPTLPGSWPAYFNDLTSPTPSCKVAQPGHRYGNAVRLFSV